VPRVRPVVLDTSVVLPAALSPHGYRRRFWVLLAFGALAARRNLTRLEADALRSEAGAAGGESGGLPVDAAAAADERYRRLRELLPAGCPWTARRGARMASSSSAKPSVPTYTSSPTRSTAANATDAELLDHAFSLDPPRPG